MGAPSGNFMVLRFESRSEITELSGLNGVRTFRTNRSLFVGTAPSQKCS